MALLAGKLYDPAVAGTAATTAATAMAALDTTNLRLTFTVPSNGRVLVRMGCGLVGFTNSSTIQVMLGVMSGATIMGRALGATYGFRYIETSFLVTGLTPGSSQTWDAAFSSDSNVASSGLRWGGPNNTLTGDAWGGFIYEIWEA